MQKPFPEVIMKMILSDEWNKKTVLKNIGHFDRLLGKLENTVSATHLNLNQKRARIYAALSQMEFYLKDLRNISAEASQFLSLAKESLKNENFENILIPQINLAKNQSEQVQREINALI